MAMNAARLVKDVGKVYSLPNIYYQIDEAIDDPATTAAHIGAIISEDTGLSARLLRLVNSPFYGFPSKIDTISRAVTIIGTRQLRDLVLATSVVHLFKGLPDDLIDMERFWRHSIACGVTARIMAAHRHEANVESFFVSGLLHDIGSLIVYTKVPKEAAEALLRSQQDERLLYEVEAEVLGFDHATVGGLLLKEWKLPPSLAESVAFHHRPRRAALYPLETATVHVADIVANALQLGTSGERLVPPMDKKAWETLGISENFFASAVTLIERQYGDAVRHILKAGA